ncbi:hypothetical protein [Pseudonocardia spinosispora]|uniref:hypothetical protein n=1 Tax=Pseudonocardia spinosispora TaxID=103441 RepID=UPI00040C1A27|nr:hypothetical protein [Pseudonocardia spinosispora]
MPIRSPKGRGAAYRSLWQWPLRSPGRLVGCFIVLLGLIIAGNSLLGQVFHRGATTAPTSTAPAVPTFAAPPPAAAPTRLPPVPELRPTVLPPAEAPQAALTVATRWTQAWAKHPTGTSTQTWVNGLKPYTTEEYLGVLSTVDPTNIPANKVTGPARAVLVSPNSVRVEIPTDAVKLVVLVVNTTEGGSTWKVAGYDRADD